MADGMIAGMPPPLRNPYEDDYGLASLIEDWEPSTKDRRCHSCNQARVNDNEDTANEARMAYLRHPWARQVDGKVMVRCNYVEKAMPLTKLLKRGFAAAETCAGWEASG